MNDDALLEGIKMGFDSFLPVWVVGDVFSVVFSEGNAVWVWLSVLEHKLVEDVFTSVIGDAMEMKDRHVCHSCISHDYFNFYVSNR